MHGNGIINIGFGNIVSASRIVAVINPDSAPVKRLIQDGRDKGVIIDATQGRRTRAVIVTDSNYLILSSLLPETIAGRINGKAEQGNDVSEEK